MELKNKDVFGQFKVMLGKLDAEDPGIHRIMLNLLQLVFQEYNSGRKQQIEKSLYEFIDAEVNFKLKK